MCFKHYEHLKAKLLRCLCSYDYSVIPRPHFMCLPESEGLLWDVPVKRAQDYYDYAHSYWWVAVEFDECFTNTNNDLAYPVLEEVWHGWIKWMRSSLNDFLYLNRWLPLTFVEGVPAFESSLKARFSDTKQTNHTMNVKYNWWWPQLFMLAKDRLNHVLPLLIRSCHQII